MGYGQKTPGIVKGILQDETGSQPLADATVSIMLAKDSSLVSFTLTSNSGYFEVKNLAVDDYYVIISYQGYETLKQSFSIKTDDPVADLKQVKMHSAYKTLQEVVVVDEAPIKIKGDTLAYNADAFKTKPNATVEDLLKKLPGVQVEKDGTVKAQGENVQKVYVDGKEFFGNDPKMATKNLAADMVDQVEVYDDMSEQAKFNQIDDGSRSKAINLKLKKDKKKGLFGKFSAGYGTEDRYEAGATANFFKGATQVSIIGKTNNTNNLGFSISDMIGLMGSGGMGAMGGGGMSIISGGGGRGGFNLGSLNLGGGGGGGITTSSQLGINYRDTWSPKFDANGSYSFNNTGRNNNSRSFRQTTNIDTVINRDQNTISQTDNYNHRFNYNLIYSIDSFNSLIYTPQLSFQKTDSYSDDTTLSVIQKNGNAYIGNDTRNINDNEGDGYSWTNNLIWRHKTRKIGRTLSVNLSNTLSNNSRDGLQFLNQGFYDEFGVKTRELNRNLKSDQENDTKNFGANVSYTEPLSREKILELNYGFNKNQYENDRSSLGYNPATGKYEFEVPDQTNHTLNENRTNRFGTNFRYIKKKFNFQLGLSLQNTLLEGDNFTKNINTSQRYNNLLPTASFNYQFARSRSFRFNYRARTNLPSISQLQEVQDITNPLYIRNGNKDLKQEYSNNFMLSYNFFDMIKFRSLFALINFSTTNDKIVDSIRNNGVIQNIRPANLDGVYNVSGVFNLGFPIKKMKGGNFNTNTRINYGRNGNFIDGMKNFTKNLTLGEDLRLSYNYKDKLDLGLNTSINYTSVKYSDQVKSQNRGFEDQSYFTQVYSADFTYTFSNGFIISTDMDYTINPSQGADIDRDFAMWNASIAKQLFKNKRGEIKLSAFDLLNQNTSFNRNFGDNYYEDVYSNTLNRFYMLSFTYNLNRMGGKSMLPRFLERGTRNIRISM